jgi:lysophospholipid acyltransferase (LPLAT)-like uncharacterized protein
VKIILEKIGTLLLVPLLKMLFASLRMDVGMPEEGLPAARRGIIFAFWHGSMATGWLLVRRLFPDAAPVAVVSLSPDGQILSETLDRLGFRLIRGSSSRGRDAVREGIAGELGAGGIVAVTPDGPRGPIHRFKYGTVRLASVNRAPILFADIVHGKSRKLRSWDRFEIPLPFSRVKVSLHLIDVPVFSSENELHEFANGLSERFAHA